MRTLIEHLLLLEYDHEKTWLRHGHDIMNRRRSEYGMEQMPKSGFDPNPHAPDAKMWDTDSKFVDPTPHREYGQWIAKTYGNGGIRHSEDLTSRVMPALERFHDAKKRGHLKRMGLNADINSYKTLSDLEDMVEKLPHPEPKDQDRPDPSEYSRHESEHWTHIVPHTEKASKFYGRGTRWCTAADKHCMFNRYHEEGKLHILIPKKPKYPGEKYQLHHESESFMDEKDEPAPYSVITHERPAPTVEAYHHEMANSPNAGSRMAAVQWSSDHGIHSKLAKDENISVRRMVARHTPYHDVAARLADDSEAYVREMIADRHDQHGRHPFPDLEETLASDVNPTVRGTIARHSSNKQLLGKMLTPPEGSHPSEHLQVLNQLALNRNAKEQHLELSRKGAEVTGGAVQKILARNSADHETQMNLANSYLPEVREALAGSGFGLHHDVLEKLTKDPSASVRYALGQYFPSPESVATHPGRTPEYDRALQNALADEHVAHGLAARGDQFHDQLVDHPSPNVRGIVAAFTNRRAHLEKLRNDPDENVKRIAELAYKNKEHNLR